jgi:hypothetical protein
MSISKIITLAEKYEAQNFYNNPAKVEEWYAEAFGLTMDYSSNSKFDFSSRLTLDEIASRIADKGYKVKRVDNSIYVTKEDSPEVERFTWNTFEAEIPGTRNPSRMWTIVTSLRVARGLSINEMRSLPCRSAVG